MKVYVLSLCYSAAVGNYSFPQGVFSTLYRAKKSTPQAAIIVGWRLEKHASISTWFPIYLVELGPQSVAPYPVITEHKVDEDYQEAVS